jgi:hypothetical protein
MQEAIREDFQEGGKPKQRQGERDCCACDFSGVCEEYTSQSCEGISLGCLNVSVQGRQGGASLLTLLHLLTQWSIHFVCGNVEV